VALAVPERRQVELLRQAQRYLLAMAQVKAKAAQHNLTTAQKQQLEDRRKDEALAAESAWRLLYPTIWLPVMEGGAFRLENVTTAGRPLTAQGLHEKLMELLTAVPPYRVFTTLTPHKMVEWLRLGADGGGRGIHTADVVDAFYRVPGFPRLLNDAVIRQAIAAGVSQGVFAYVRAGQVDPNRVKEGSGYLVETSQARIGADIAPADIDLDNALIVLPQAIEPAGGPTPVPAGAVPGLSGPAGAATDRDAATRGRGEGGTTEPGTPPLLQQQTWVRLAMRLTRQQLYATVNALRARSKLTWVARSGDRPQQTQKLFTNGPLATWLTRPVVRSG
jgi:hypothetical protein